jgi:hypothetical protein
MEQAYAEELSQAREEIAEMRRTLEANYGRLREIWGMRGQQLPPEETDKLRAEFKRLADENAKTELKIAERQVELAQKALDIALERLVQAKVELHEAHIKQRRRESWFRGEWGRHMRDRRPRDSQEQPGDDAQPNDKGVEDEE